MELLFLTGMSGAGKSAAVRYLEDCGYFCMDNVPPYVLPDLVKSFYRGRSGEGFSTPKLALSSISDHRNTWTVSMRL